LNNQSALQDDGDLLRISQERAAASLRMSSRLRDSVSMLHENSDDDAAIAAALDEEETLKAPSRLQSNSKKA